MDFQYTPEQETFRAEVRSWLEAHLPPDLCVDDARDERVAPDRETFERRRAWQKTMHTAGWVGIAWPQQYGGGGAGLIEHDFRRGVQPGARPRPAGLLRGRAVRPNSDAVGDKRAKATLPAAHSQR